MGDRVRLRRPSTRATARRRRKGQAVKPMDREQLRRTLTGPSDADKRREVATHVSEPVKRAIDQAIKQNKSALRELASH